MKTRNILIMAVSVVGLPLSAQDIYKMEMFSGEDLNGTARFVGMGGAMSALGADLSTMGTNPAGIGMYRTSDVALSGSALIQPNAENFCDRGKTRASFDQAGFVYVSKLYDSDLKFVNFGFNYHKRRNLKNFIGVDNFSTDGLSQSWQMLDLTYLNNGFLDLENNNDRQLTTPLTLLGYDTQMLEMVRDENGNVTGYIPVYANSYNYKRVQWGGVHQYDFNLSFNWKDRLYAGVTFGVYDVDIHTSTDYSEMLVNESDPNGTYDYYTLYDEALTGSGFDFKLGLIYRPIEDSPLRVGLAVHTPTIFNLKSAQYTYMSAPFAPLDDDGNVTDYTKKTEKGMDPGENNYYIRTPWKFNISLATTVGRFLALDAEYEFKDYGSAKVKYDYDGYSRETDDALSAEANHFLKPVSIFRVGAELRAFSRTYFRVGYNYESSPFDKDAYLNLFTNSSSYYYSMNTDYVNLSAINRYTCGVGYRGKHLYADIAYQYQHQTGEVYAFHLPETNSELNRLSAASVDLDRHQLLFTLGYKF